MTIGKSIQLLVSILALAGCNAAIHQVERADMTDGAVSATDFTFNNDGVDLAATLLLPEDSIDIGVVMLPGSGPADRAMMRPAAEQFAAQGVTVLFFDKRGSGASGGNWTRTSLDQLAGDATAALRELRARADVSAAGLWAHSQGNWVSTRAIELGATPSFLVAVSGGGASPRESERHSYGHSVAAFSKDDQDAAMAIVDSYFDYLSGHMSRAALDDRIDEIKEEDWYAALGISNVLIPESYRPIWHWVATYDPATSNGSQGVPTLVLLGGADHTIPLYQTIADWNVQLSAAQNTDLNRILVLPERDHHLRKPVEGQHHGVGVSTEPLIWNSIDAWMKELLAPTD